MVLSRHLAGGACRLDRSAASAGRLEESSAAARDAGLVLHLGAEREAVPASRGRGCPPCSRCPSWPATSGWATCAPSPRRGALRANETLVLEHSATIAALQMAQDRVRFETEVRLKGDFVDDVVSGGGAGRRLPAAARSLSRLRSEPGGHGDPARRWTSSTGLVARKDLGQEELDRRVERFFTRCSRHVSAAEPLSLASLKSGRVVVFVCGKTAHDPAALRKLARSCRTWARRRPT